MDLPFFLNAIMLGNGGYDRTPRLYVPAILVILWEIAVVLCTVIGVYGYWSAEHPPEGFIVPFLELMATLAGIGVLLLLCYRKLILLALRLFGFAEPGDE